MASKKPSKPIQPDDQRSGALVSKAQGDTVQTSPIEEHCDEIEISDVSTPGSQVEGVKTASARHPDTFAATVEKFDQFFSSDSETDECSGKFPGASALPSSAIEDVADKFSTTKRLESDPISSLTYKEWAKTAEVDQSSPVTWLPDEPTIPEKFEQFLSDQCLAKDITIPSWYFSLSDNTLIITGNGITKIPDDTNIQFVNHKGSTEVRMLVDNHQTLMLLKFNIEFVDSDLVTIPLSGRIHNDSGTIDGTSELILRAERDDKYFAAASLHIIMEHGEMATLDGSLAVPSDQQEELLEKVVQRFDQAKLVGKGGRPEAFEADLNTQPLHAYRTHAGAGHMESFMCDTALFPLVNGAAQRYAENSVIQKQCMFDDIVCITQVTEIEEMRGRRPHQNVRPEQPEVLPTVLRASQNRIGRVVGMRGSLPGTQIGHQIGFVLVSGDPFVPTDSGSIIFTRNRLNDGSTYHIALAMLKGLRPGTGPDDRRVLQPGQAPRPAIYEGIVLEMALRELRDQGNLSSLRPFPSRN